jgi:hypothetical protein
VYMGKNVVSITIVLSVFACSFFLSGLLPQANRKERQKTRIRNFANKKAAFLFI